MPHTHNKIPDHNRLRGWRRLAAIGALASLGGLGLAACASSSAESPATHAGSRPAAAGPSAEALRAGATLIATKATQIGNECLQLRGGDAHEAHQPDGTITTAKRLHVGNQDVACSITQGKDQTIQAVSFEAGGKGASLTGVFDGDGDIVHWTVMQTELIDGGQHQHQQFVNFQVGGGNTEVQQAVCQTGTFNCYDAGPVSVPEKPTAFAQDTIARMEHLLAEVTLAPAS